MHDRGYGLPRIPLPRTPVNRVGSRGLPRGSLLYVLALAISRNCEVVEGGVAQGLFWPGEAVHRAYHLCKQLRERLCLLRTHVLIGHVEHQPAVRLRLRRLLLTGCAAGGAARGTA